MFTKRKFRSTTIITLFLLAFCFTLFIFSISTVNSNDVKEYKQLSALSDSSQHKEQTPYVATQQHHKARKDIWFVQNGQRLQLQVHSEDIALVLDRHDDVVDIIENMQGVKCYMQEKLYIDEKTGKQMQFVRYLQADKASYDYQKEQFRASHVRISQFAINGNQLPQKIVEPSKTNFTGTAKTVEFTVDDEGKLNFIANQVKASIATGDAA